MVLVNENCIWCGVCESIAPTIFNMNSVSGKSNVVKQPENEAEDNAVDVAIASCPVTAIEKWWKVIEMPQQKMAA